MKRLLVLLACLLAVPAQGQILSIIMGGTNQPAATPTFSPVAGAVANPTTVTASTSTSDGCTIYFDTSNPPTTAQTTYSVTTGVTLYAQARGCAHHRDSSVGSATYTISAVTITYVKSACGVTGANPYTLSFTPTSLTDTVIFQVVDYYDGNSVSSIHWVGGSAGSLGAAIVSHSNGGTVNTNALAISSLYGATSAPTGTTGVSVTMSTGSNMQVCAIEYSGPVRFGNTATAGNASGGSAYTASVTTQDANNYAVCGVGGSSGSWGALTATAGTIRVQTETTTNNAIQDNTAASPGSVVNSGTMSSYINWAQTCVELRTQ